MSLLGSGCVDIFSHVALQFPPRLTAKSLMFSVCSNLTVAAVTKDVRSNSVCFWCWQDEENGNEKGKHLSLFHIRLIKRRPAGRTDDVRAALAPGGSARFLCPLQHILPHCSFHLVPTKSHK